MVNSRVTSNDPVTLVFLSEKMRNMCGEQALFFRNQSVNKRAIVANISLQVCQLEVLSNQQ